VHLGKEAIGDAASNSLSRINRLRTIS